MKAILRILTPLALVPSLLLPGCETAMPANPRPQPCTHPWYQLVESRVPVLDADGHGPDIGSSEWMSAIDSKLGISDGQGHGPDPGSPEWCTAVDRKVFGN